MRVTVFCEQLDISVSDIPGHGIDITFEQKERLTTVVIGYEKAKELGKAVEFLMKQRECGEVLF